MLASGRHRSGRWLLGKALTSPRLSRLRSVPRPLRLALQRDGLDPVVELGMLRDHPPVSKLMNVLGTKVWLVSGYAEARAVLADTSSYSNDVRRLAGGENATGPEAIGGLGFTEAGAPGTDLVETFAFPAPFLVICELLGLSSDDRDGFRELGDARFDVSAGGVGLLGAMSESREFLIDAVARQRANPDDALIGALLSEHGAEIDDVELGGLADGVFTGGYETSASMLALGSSVLLRHPASLEQIATDDIALDCVVEELLRYLSVT